MIATIALNAKAWLTRAPGKRCDVAFTLRVPRPSVVKPFGRT